MSHKWYTKYHTTNADKQNTSNTDHKTPTTQSNTTQKKHSVHKHTAWTSDLVFRIQTSMQSAVRWMHTYERLQAEKEHERPTLLFPATSALRSSRVLQQRTWPFLAAWRSKVLPSACNITHTHTSYTTPNWNTYQWTREWVTWNEIGVGMTNTWFFILTPHSLEVSTAQHCNCAAPRKLRKRLGTSVLCVINAHTGFRCLLLLHTVYFLIDAYTHTHIDTHKQTSKQTDR